MLVVMTVVALLLSVMAPSYVRHIDRARETVLKQNLMTVRDAIGKFKTDQGRWPLTLQELVTSRYLRAIPVDPITDRADTWVASSATDGSAGIEDLHSGAQGTATDGSRYAVW
jgi:general secretion pathway protein G